VSLTDPQAAWVTRPGVDPHFAYDANYLIDNKVGIIIDAEGTRANRIEEIAITQTMIDRVERRFGLRPQRLAGDTVCGAGRLLKWLVDRAITPHVPVWNKSARPDGKFSRADFVFIGSATYTFARPASSSPTKGSSTKVVSSWRSSTRSNGRSAPKSTRFRPTNGASSWRTAP
jgi:hypothetical protein